MSIHAHRCGRSTCIGQTRKLSHGFCRTRQLGVFSVRTATVHATRVKKRQEPRKWPKINETVLGRAVGCLAKNHVWQFSRGNSYTALTLSHRANSDTSAGRSFSMADSISATVLMREKQSPGQKAGKTSVKGDSRNFHFRLVSNLLSAILIL